MKIISFSFIAACLLCSCKSSPKPSSEASSRNPVVGAGLPDEIQIAFYNVENLFDLSDHPDKIDEDFLPGGRYNWTKSSYQGKLSQLGKALVGMGEEGPHILGIAEVENAEVVEDLFEQNQEILRSYELVHEESPDMRGIDVALAYDPTVFQYIRHQKIPYFLPQDPNYTSRDILLVEGKVGNETLYVMVNHWPSRRDGPEASEPRRLRAAELARAAVDSLLDIDGRSNIILMGDFNDDPSNRSIDLTLMGEENIQDLSEEELYNPLAELHNPQEEGTLVYKGKWNLFDQILLSEELLSPLNGLRYLKGSATIYSKNLTVGFGRGAANPRRGIFRGKFDPEGFSDHFPVYVRLKVVQP